jgi:hypothetical protein
MLPKNNLTVLPTRDLMTVAIGGATSLLDTSAVVSWATLRLRVWYLEVELSVGGRDLSVIGRSFRQ